MPWVKVRVQVRIFGKTHTQNAHVRVRVRLEFWKKAHVRAMCVRPDIECANVRACEAKNRRNSQFDYFIKNQQTTIDLPFLTHNNSAIGSVNCYAVIC